MHLQKPRAFQKATTSALWDLGERLSSTTDQAIRSKCIPFPEVEHIQIKLKTTTSDVN